jgi:superfamily II DNA/RNA helicase
LGGALLTGRQPPDERLRHVEAFQAGAHRLLIATFGAGGLGFTLHRAGHVVLIERPWTPGDTEQAEDRCHRLGMEGGLTCHWLQLGVVDLFVDELIASKAQRITQLLQRRTMPALARELLSRW